MAERKDGCRKGYTERSSLAERASWSYHHSMYHVSRRFEPLVKLTFPMQLPHRDIVSMQTETNVVCSFVAVESGS